MLRENPRIGDTLRQLRTDRHLSLAAVAEQAGISAATLSRIETNKQNVDIGMLLKLARILGASSTDLLGGNHDGDGTGAIARRLAALPPGQRLHVLRASGQRKTRPLEVILDDLQATIDALRDELMEFHDTVRRRERKPAALRDSPERRGRERGP